jgi:cysteine desulfurase/selenocysteine lyase
MTESFIYLDNAATSYPKPGIVLEKMVETYAEIGVSPGRGSYDRAVEAEGIVQETREKIARFFGASDPDRVIFTLNATDALNIAIQGLVEPGDHVVSTRLEHNSVLRPLHHLREQNIITYDLVSFDKDGFVDPRELGRQIRPETRLVVISHASNVLGTVQPVGDVGRVCAEHDVKLVVDVTQSAGLIPVDMTAWQAAAIAFTGHKSLLGPTGTGGLAVAPGIDIRPTRFGGTGIESKSPVHTQSYPHRLEAGTLNLLGIIGLSAGMDYLHAEGIETIYRREMTLLKRLRDGFLEVGGIELYGTEQLEEHVGLITVTVDGVDPEDVAAILDADFDIAVRAGLHCAPLVHETLGTMPRGGVRFSLGPFNTRKDMDGAVSAMAAVRRSGMEVAH